ncbi:Golgi apparatus membrane protein TVP23 [Coprinopsis marcescibilis]|uniref:Golgi apparatus membrane protein TVP23 n=1 Tax=Coprinopsis marcescibilis TaxID=230819 RepID=A0A5C3LC16_COPMA|nr:Golgi apparatus membrane protein TVP23 [Coprinopsis marcescibilis]
MSVAQPLLATIEPDDGLVPAGNIELDRRSQQPRPEPVVLTPRTGDAPQQRMATTEGDAESGIAGIFRQSAHPLALFFLFFFRVTAILVYILCGWFTDNYVLSTVTVVVLLAMDFWNCRNVAGRTLVGLRFWNQVDEDGESYWVFESRDPSRPPNPVDSKYIALYVFPLLWAALLIVSILKLGFAFIPIVILALVFNVTNVVGFTYADRDAKQKWADSVVGGSWGIGGIGGQLLTSAVKRGVGRVFG